MAPTESDETLGTGGTELAAQPPKSILYTPDKDVDEWVNDVDEVSQQIQDILNGTITDFEKFDHDMHLKQRAKEIRVEEAKAKRERLILYGTEGKGEGKNYKWWCKRCFVEYSVDLQENKCTRCKQSDKMMTPEQRREELMEKLDTFKGEKVKHQFRKDKWLRWKKSQAMLKRSRNINYKAWEYWEPDTDTEDEGDPILPKENPEFRAMEADMKQRNKKQSERTQTAQKMRERGNQCMKEGDYVGAIENYEEGLEYRRDMKELWTNKALAEIKIFRWQDAIASANRVIEYSEIFEDGFTKSRDACFKAFMRRAVALRALQKWDEALEDLEDAVKLFPKDREARDLHLKTRAAVEEAKQACNLHGNDNARVAMPSSESASLETPSAPKESSPEPVKEVAAEIRSDGSVRIEIEESDDDEEIPIPAAHSSSLAGMSKHDFVKLTERLGAKPSERTLFCSRRQGDSIAFAHKSEKEKERDGRKVVLKVEEVPDASGLDNLLKDVERCSILWKKHQGSKVEQIVDPYDAAAAREALNFLKITVPRALEVLHLLASNSDHHCELSSGGIRHVWPLLSSDDWRQQVLQVLMEWSQRSVSARAMAEFASRYPNPHFQLLVEAIAEEKKENILPPNFEATARAATERLEKGDHNIDKALDEIMKGLNTLSPAELAVSTLGNICVAGHVLPAFKEQVAPFCSDIVTALCRLLRPMDWRLCGRAAGAIANILRLGEVFLNAVEEKCLVPLVSALREESSNSAHKRMSMIASLGVGDSNERLPFVNATAKLLAGLVNFVVIRPSGVKRVQELGLLEIVVPLISTAHDASDATTMTNEDDQFAISSRALALASKLIREAPAALSLQLEADVLRRLDKILENECRSIGSSKNAQLECSLDAVDLSLRILTTMITKSDGVLDRLTGRIPRFRELLEGESLEDLDSPITFDMLISRLMKVMCSLKTPEHVSPDDEGSVVSRIRGNLALLFAKLAEAQADADAPPVLKELNFEHVVDIFVDWLRKERGPVQQNVGVALTRLAQNPQYRQRVRDLNGIESLHQIMLPRVEAQKAEASRLHRLRSMSGLD